MVKLKKNVVDFMMTNIKSDKVGNYVRATLNQKKDGATSIIWNIPSFASLCGKGFSFLIDEKDFEEVEDLKPFTLYTSDKFDGNPNMYTLLVKYPQDGWATFSEDYECMTEIDDEVTHFMYLDENINE